MDYQRFARMRGKVWDQFEAILAKAGNRRSRLSYEELEEAAFRYRQVLHDLALARSRFPRTGAVTRLRGLALRGTRLLTQEQRSGRGGLVRFFTEVYPAAFRRQLPTFGLALAFFLAITVLALVTSIQDPALAMAFLGEEHVSGLREGRLWTERLTTSVPPAVSSSGIATNNVGVGLTAWGGGAAAGIGSLFILLVNGIMLGSVIGLTMHYSMAGELFEFIAAHGPLELSIIILSAAAGLVLGRGLIAPGDRPRSESLRIAARESLILIGGFLPWLVLLAVIEALLSPSPDYGAGFKLLVGLSLEALFLFVSFAPWRSERGDA